MSTPFTIKIASTAQEVSAARTIREQVFVREQEIPAHLDADGLDDSAFHVLAYEGSRAVATGRLVVGGLGRLVVFHLEALATRLDLRELTLQPHTHLERFYQSLGYEKVSGTSVAGQHVLITMRKRLGPAASSELYH